MAYRRSIYRYPHREPVITALNPLEDVTTWVRGLRSPGYTCDLLKDTHGITAKRELRKSTDAVCSYADHAISLLEQAFEGPPSVSFLPCYYALLNLAKIYIVASGRRVDLEQPHNRRHGIGYEIKNSHNLLTETIKLRGNGVVPRFYEVITGEKWPIKPHEKPQLKRMRRYYPYVYNVGHEFTSTFERRIPLVFCRVRMEGDRGRGFRLRVRLSHLPSGGRRNLRLVSGMRKLNDQEFVSTYVSGPTSDAMQELLGGFPQHLLYWGSSLPRYPCLTPVKNQILQLPEEIPILLCFFHLGSVVRYNPSLLSKLQRSEAWSLILSLRKHSVLRFLVLFWSFLNDKQFELRPPHTVTDTRRG